MVVAVLLHVPVSDIPAFPGVWAGLPRSVGWPSQLPASEGNKAEVLACDFGELARKGAALLRGRS